MYAHVLEKQFARIGARAEVQTPADRFETHQLAIEVRDEGDAERFVIIVSPRVLSRLAIVDIQPRVRHLLLMSREEGEIETCVCGHNGRRWFAVTITAGQEVLTVRRAVQLLRASRVVRRPDLPLRARLGGNTAASGTPGLPGPVCGSDQVA